MRRTPPYLSYTTFRNFLDSLRVTAVPTRIDRGIMANMSGANQSLLLSTIRYLGLASENGIPTADLKQLIEAKESERKQVWRRILMRGYSEIFDSKFDLERTTTDELSQVFRRQGVTSSDRIRKCVTFFTLAARDADIKLSPHIRPYSGKRQTSRRTRGKAEEGVNDLLKSSDSNGSTAWQPPKFPDFDPSWPEELRKNWLESFAQLLKILKDTNPQ